MAAMRDENKKKGSSLGMNLLLFAAILFGFVAFMKWWNEGKPKEGSMFGGGPPAADQMREQPPAPQGSAGDAEISGRISLAPGIAQKAPNAGTVFVIARGSGMPEVGPPIAVRRYDAVSLPLSFTLGPSNVMMQGVPFEGPFDVYARLDGDGNVMTKDPTDVTVSKPASGVKPGDRVEILLDRMQSDPPGAAPPTPPTVPASAPAAVSGGGSFSGRIVLAPDLAASAPAGTLYVMLRPAGVPAGPPIAAKKIEQPRFPAEFEMGPSDVMMQGVPFEGPFDVTVRLDADGNAMTKQPGDLVTGTPKANVKPGDSGVEIVLDKRL
jgi:cytochrome c-type biogenesis protein CcmH